MITTITIDPPLTTTPFYFTQSGIYNANFDIDIFGNIFVYIIFALLWIIPLVIVFWSICIKWIVHKMKG